MHCLHVLLACVVGLTVGGTARGENVDDEYMISFQEDTTVKEVNACIEELAKNAITVKKKYRFGSLSVLYVSGTTKAIMEARKLPKIERIEQNGEVDASGNQCSHRDSPATWGLDRIDQKEPLTYQNEFTPGLNYTIGPLKGQRVNVYVVDTGIDTSHPDFARHAWWGYTAIGMDGDVDNNGHGTHVAGIIGSSSYGVANQATLVAVKVLKANAKGTFASIVDGLSWVHAQIVRWYWGKHIVFLPWSGPKENTINNVIKSLVSIKGVVIAAAGNNDGDACLRTPASAPGVTTVASMNIRDRASTFSNWGKCVHLHAPGLNILSTWPGNSTKVMSGTSMAAAHAAGVAALHLTLGQKTSGQVRAWLVRESGKGKLTFPDANHAKTPNRLLYDRCYQ